MYPVNKKLAISPRRTCYLFSKKVVMGFVGFFKAFILDYELNVDETRG